MISECDSSIRGGKKNPRCLHRTKDSTDAKSYVPNSSNYRQPQLNPGDRKELRLAVLQRQGEEGQSKIETRALLNQGLKLDQ